jgi:tetratricopeptide (TPR) repeat protein
MRRAGEYAAALAEFESLERKSSHPQDIAALQLFQCMCLTDSGRIEEAHQRIGRVNKNRLGVISRVEYESEHARIKRAQGKIEEALDQIEKAIKIAQTVENKLQIEEASTDMLALHGVLLAQCGRCDEAMPILECVPMGNPWWAEARIHLGDCKVRKRLHQEAIETYLSIVSSSKEVHPFHRLTALRNIGYAYYYLGQYAKATEYLIQVEHDYDDEPEMKADLFGMLASAYSRQGKVREATKYGGFTRSTGSVQ